MRHLIPLIIKYFLIALSLSLILPLFGRNAVTAVFYTAVPITVILYTLSDLTVLPRHGNAAASVFSALMTGLILWASVYLLPGLTPSWSGSLLGSMAIGISDWYYHRWLIRNGIINGLEI
jgi:prepilin signal peptidase PulO-like enzyme (type II secretory pathway)